MPPRLNDGDVHVWRVGVPSSAQGLAPCAALLEPSERARAERLASTGARARYVAGRAAVRIVLAPILDLPPEALRFTRRCGRCGGVGHGKPCLLSDAAGIDFNLAHSDRVAVVAVARGRRVGVDVERLRRRIDVLAVARHALSPLETATIAALPPADRRAAFFHCWTRKEAYLKARAEGLPGRLRGWSVSPVGTGPVAPEIPGEPEESRRWAIRSLELGGDDYVGAVAGEGRWTLRRFDLALP